MYLKGLNSGEIQLLANNGNKCFVNRKKSTDASIFGLNSHQSLQRFTGSLVLWPAKKRPFVKKNM